MYELRLLQTEARALVNMTGMAVCYVCVRRHRGFGCNQVMDLFLAMPQQSARLYGGSFTRAVKVFRHTLTAVRYECDVLRPTMPARPLKNSHKLCGRFFTWCSFLSMLRGRGGTRYLTLIQKGKYIQVNIYHKYRIRVL